MPSTECIRGVQGDLVPFTPTALVRLSPMHDARDLGADICFAARGHPIRLVAPLLLHLRRL